MICATLPRFEFEYETGKLKAYTSIGSYPLLYIDKSNSVLCPCCANEAEKIFIEAEAEDPGQNGFLADDLPVAAHVNYEGDTYCDECGERIESAYGETD